MKIAFQGEEGSFTEEAIIKQFSNNCEKIACKELIEVFKKVENNECDYGVIPVENSVEGTITESYDLLLESKLKIRNEINLRIKHYLLANKKISLNEIKNIYSHTQAFGQCKKFLNKFSDAYPFELISFVFSFCIAILLEFWKLRSFVRKLQSVVLV